MSASFYDLLKYAATGQASPSMTQYDKLRASTLMGGVVQTLTGQPPLSFKSDGSPLISWSMKGNGSQSGTPTPDAPIMPTFCGTLDGTDWKIPITCAGQTVPVYLGQVSTVRKIRKLVLTGEETWYMWNLQSETLQRFYTRLPTGMVSQGVLAAICSHFETVQDNTQESMRFSASSGQNYNQPVIVINRSRLATVDVAGFKSYLSAQYQNGTPVTIWYILAEPTTGIVNEPLCKIGDYADELHSEDAGVTISTAKGQNTLTVDTPIQPSEMTITFKG